MASSSAITTRVGTGEDLRRCSGRFSGRARRSAGRAGRPACARAARCSTAPRRGGAHGVGVALGLAVLVLGQRRLGHQGPQAGVVGLLGEVAQLLVGDGQLLAELAEPVGRPRTGGARRATGTWRPKPRRAPWSGQRQGRDLRASVQRVGVVAAVLVAGRLPASPACGDDGEHGVRRRAAAATSARSGSTPTRRAACTCSAAPEPEYLTDPPTSGPHAPAPSSVGRARRAARPTRPGRAPRGRRRAPPARAGLAPTELADLEALAGDGVVVVPNDDLPAPVVATAWLVKQMRCDDGRRSTRSSASSPPIVGDRTRKPMADAWGIDDGYWDVAGDWHDDPEPTRRRSGWRWAGRRRRRPAAVEPPGVVRAPRAIRRPSTGRPTSSSRTAPTLGAPAALPADLPARLPRPPPVRRRARRPASIVVPDRCAPAPRPCRRAWPSSSTRPGRGRAGASATSATSPPSAGGPRGRRRRVRWPSARCTRPSRRAAPEPSPYFPSSPPLAEPAAPPDRGRPRLGRGRRGAHRPRRRRPGPRRATASSTGARSGPPSGRPSSTSGTRGAQRRRRRRRLRGIRRRQRRVAPPATPPSAPSPSTTAAVGAVAGRAPPARRAGRRPLRGRARPTPSGSTPGCSGCSTVSSRRAAAAGPGLVHDLAVGADPDGADAWTWQDVLALDVRVGAPPDEFNADGPGLGPAAVRPVAAAGRRLRAARRAVPGRLRATAPGCASTTSWACSGCSGSPTAASRAEGALRPLPRHGAARRPRPRERPGRRLRRRRGPRHRRGRASAPPSPTATSSPTGWRGSSPNRPRPGRSAPWPP